MEQRRRASWHDRLALSALPDTVGACLQLASAGHREDRVGVELDYLLLEGGWGRLGAGLLLVILRAGACELGKGLKSNSYSS